MLQKYISEKILAHNGVKTSICSKLQQYVKYVNGLS